MNLARIILVGATGALLSFGLLLPAVVIAEETTKGLDMTAAPQTDAEPKGETKASPYSIARRKNAERQREQHGAGGAPQPKRTYKHHQRPMGQ